MKGSRGDVKLVNVVIDSLYLRVARNRQPSSWLRDTLETVRAYRQAFDDNPNLEPLVIQHPELGSFTVFARTSAPFDFALMNPKIAEIKIWNPDKWHSAVTGATGQLYVAFRSEFLQFAGTDAALEFIATLERVLMSDAQLIPSSQDEDADLEFTRVSRPDLACDTQEPRGMKWSDLDLFTCRARKRDAFKVPPLEEMLERALEESRGEVLPPRNNKGGDPGTLKHQNFVRHGSEPILDTRCASLLRDLARARGLAVDAVHWLIVRVLRGVGFDSALGFVSRVVSNGSSQLQTVYFGRFGSALYARRYDKLASLSVQGKEFMRDVWRGNGWNGSSPVWRTEFALSGDFLRAVRLEGTVLDLRDVGLFLAAVPRLWHYLTRDWLVLHEAGAEVSHDAIRKRAASDLWRVIQGAHESLEGITRAKPEPKPVLEQLQAQLDGIATTALAMLDSPRFRRAVDTVTGKCSSR
jgi:hypothetical protein